MVDIQSAAAEIRQGKDRRRRDKETTGQKYNGLTYYIGLSQTGQKYNVRICYAGRP